MQCGASALAVGAVVLFASWPQTTTDTWYYNYYVNVFTPTISFPTVQALWSLPWKQLLSWSSYLCLSPTLSSFRVDTCFISPLLESCVWLKVVLKSVFVEDSNQLMYIKLSFIIGTVIWIPVMGSFAKVPVLFHSLWVKGGHGCLAYIRW